MARLKLLKGRKTWKEFRIVTPLTRIGRDQGHCHVLLDERTVSRKHAEIIQKDNEYFLVDRDSKAGTTLDRIRLRPEQPYPLKDGALISICNFLLLFLDDSRDDENLSSSVEISEVGVLPGVSSVLEASSSSRLARTNINSESKLAAITEMTQELRQARSLQDLLVKTLDSLLMIFRMAERALVLLPGSTDRVTQTSVVRHRKPVDEESKAFVNATLLEEVTERYTIALSTDALTMCASLMGRDEKPLGVIQLDAGSAKNPFTDDDLDLFATMVAEAAFAVDSWILHEAALRQRDLLLELQVATEVQMSLLPETPPEIEEYEFFNDYSPARQVGGDYYDYIELEDDRLLIALGDVSGKGIPAAILMAKVSSDISAFLACGLAPLEAIRRANVRLVDRSSECRFVTMVLVILDLRTHEIAVVNAGHMPPLLRHRDGVIEEIGADCSGLPLGVERGAQYAESRSSLTPGDTLVLFSDGVTDATSASGEMFGINRLRSAITACSGNATAFGKAIRNRIDSYVGAELQTDDICMLCITRRD